MDYIQIIIETKTEAVEALSYYITEQLEGGIEICDPKDVISQDRTQVWYDLIDENLLDVDMDVVTVKAYFAKGINVEEYVSKIENQISHISQFLDVGTRKISVVEIPKEKWMDEWKKYYNVFRIGERIVIKPSWIEYETKDNDIVIEMDPGMAFGTGTHETTAMCVELVEENLKETVLDIGTGSGILGIVAAKLGASKVIGVDIDPMAVKVANENIKINNVDMVAVEGDLLDVVTDKCELVVSNIIADIIILLATKVKSVIANGGIWIASGIINTRRDDVVEALIHSGWNIVKIVEQNEWLAIVCSRGDADA
ncbi:MAG: ribosomal protein L11 methyltransferase [Epulopiscium sp. Nele67-Bin001]|nr:MAG: ribosomal protein L11 methyltransferase [Epulopiscium sp. Nele67-Bin001]